MLRSATAVFGAHRAPLQDGAGRGMPTSGELMKRNRNGYLIVLLLSAAALVVVRGSRSVRAGRERVTLMRTPDGGIQPQVAADRKGALHLIYFKGDPAAGDVFYVRRDPGKRSFSKPLRVNSVSGSVVAIGSVRG